MLLLLINATINASSSVSMVEGTENTGTVPAPGTSEPIRGTVSKGTVQFPLYLEGKMFNWNEPGGFPV